MTLETKIARLEKALVAQQDLAANLQLSPESIQYIGDLLKGIAERPEPTIHEQIAELRDRIKRNETIEEPWKFLDEWSREELARLEAEAVKLP